MKKILIIEDDILVRESIKELLSASSYRVFCAPNGIEGMELAKELNPDLVICDIMMPKLNGYEVLESFKQEPNLSIVPFIFLTAKAEMSDLRGGMELGADDYITKPYKSSTILKAIETRLQKFDNLYHQNAEDETPHEQNTDVKLKAQDKLLIKVNGKTEVINVDDIVCITAQAQYSYVYLTGGRKVLSRKLLKQWENQLPDSIFMRVHRSSIINLNMMDKLDAWHNRSYIVKLKNFNEAIIISQRFAKKIRSKFIK